MRPIVMRPRSFPSQPAFWQWFACATVLLLSGCGKTDGPTLYRFSGTITYQGEPVPAGEVRLMPDASQGNSGPGTICKIQNGQFSTPPNKGVVGGPYIVQIWGYQAQPAGVEDETAPEWGRPLFSEYETTVNLPQEDSVEDFEVPAQDS